MQSGCDPKQSLLQEIVSLKRKINSVDDASFDELQKLLPPCMETCARKCSSKLCPQRRSAIHAQYWDLSRDQKRQYLFLTVKESPVKRITTTSDRTRRVNR